MPNWNTQNIGSSLSLPAHGRAGARATSSLAAHFAKRNTKFGGGGKARAGKKEGGWGEACLPAGREFLPALASCPVATAKRSASGVPPPPNFVPAKLARRLHIRSGNLIIVSSVNQNNVLFSC